MKASTHKDIVKLREPSSLLYDDFLHSLLKGDRSGCSKISFQLLNNRLPIKNLYEDYFRNSLYHIGELWEIGKITVATEHLASAIVDNLLNTCYPKIISEYHLDKSVVLTCVENEYHQIGLRMVADFFEMHHWNVHFLGANTPTKDLLKFLDEHKPDLLAMSMSLYYHLPLLEYNLKRLNSDLPDLPILIGGQAFRHGSRDVLNNYSNASYVSDLSQLESFIGKFEQNREKK